MVPTCPQRFVQDIVDLRKFTADEFSHIHEVLNGICKFLVAIPGEYSMPWQLKMATGSERAVQTYVATQYHCRCISVD